MFPENIINTLAWNNVTVLFDQVNLNKTICSIFVFCFRAFIVKLLNWKPEQKTNPFFLLNAKQFRSISYIFHLHLCECTTIHYHLYNDWASIYLMQTNAIIFIRDAFCILATKKLRWISSFNILHPVVFAYEERKVRLRYSAQYLQRKSQATATIVREEQR